MLKLACDLRKPSIIVYVIQHTHWFFKICLVFPWKIVFSKWYVMCYNINIRIHKRNKLFFDIFICFIYFYSFHYTHPVHGVLASTTANQAVVSRLVRGHCLTHWIGSFLNRINLLHLPTSTEACRQFCRKTQCCLNTILTSNLIPFILFVILHTDQTYCYTRTKPPSSEVSSRLQHINS